MVQLSQLHLQLTFLRLGAFGKNRQNQTHSVKDAALKLFFQITLLCRREFVVEHDQPDIMLLDRCRQFFRLARTDKQSRMRFIATRSFDRNQIAAGRAHQFCRFGQGRLKAALARFVCAGIVRRQHHADQEDAFGLFQRFIDGKQIALAQKISFQTA